MSYILLCQVAHSFFVVFLAKLTEKTVKRLLYVFSQVKWLIYHNSLTFSQYSTFSVSRFG